jgi:lipopolysaccharide biosynthesis regulator YciM
MRAGLFDRAESLFSELVDMGLHRQRALSNLKEIYQQEKDWNRCLQVARQLETVSGQTQATEIAHYYCEQAAEALEAGHSKTAWALTVKALDVDRRCVRATLMQADMERGGNDLTAAIKTYKQVVRQNSDFIPEMLPRLIDCYRQLEQRDELAEYLRGLYQQEKDARVMLAFADVLQSDTAVEEAERLVKEHLRQHADLVGVERLIALKRRDSDAESYQETLDILFHVVGRLLQRNPAYQCVRCGFSARRLHWHCPGCKGWGTVRPVPAECVEP